MKILAALLLSLLILFNSPVFAQEVIIDTRFDKADAEGRPLAEVPPFLPDALPLRIPTRIFENPSNPSAPSQLRVGKESINLLEPPYLVMQVGERPDAVSTANLGVVWDLKELHLTEGQYEISFDMMAGQTDKNGGWFQIHFTSAVSELGQGMHPTAFPASIHFTSNGLFINGWPDSGGLPAHLTRPTKFNTVLCGSIWMKRFGASRSMET